MKATLTIVVLFFAVLRAQAQPALTTNDVFSVGSLDSFRTGIVSNIFEFGLNIEQNTGSNYTWDFETGVLYLAGAYPYSCSVPSTASFPVLPPGTNMQESAPASSIENLYERLTDTIYIVRNGTSLMSGSYMFPKMRWMNFPLNYGDSAWGKQLIYTTAAQVTEAFTRTHTYKYDGYGTVRLPWGTYNNVFRIKMYTRDSSHILANYVTTYSNYLFFRQGGGMPIVRLSSATPNGDSISHGYSLLANRTVSGVTAVAFTGLSADDIAIYPNPATTTVFISTSVAGASATIADMAGRVLLQQAINGTGSIAIDKLPAGIYLVAVYDSGHRAVVKQKLVKTN